MVDFSPTPIKDLYNLGFGDLLADGTVDDKSNSNNGDIMKVLSTVIHILKEFTKDHPSARISFTGSTYVRILLYRRILRMYHFEFSKEFIINCLVPVGQEFKEIEFDPDIEQNYLVFFIERTH